jgi:hypothetical protein
MEQNELVSDLNYSFRGYWNFQIGAFTLHFKDQQSPGAPPDSFRPCFVIAWDTFQTQLYLVQVCLVMLLRDLTYFDSGDVVPVRDDHTSFERQATPFIAVAGISLIAPKVRISTSHFRFEVLKSSDL